MAQKKKKSQGGASGNHLHENHCSTETTEEKTTKKQLKDQAKPNPLRLNQKGGAKKQQQHNTEKQPQT